MTVTIPDWVPADGNVKAVWVPTVASMTAPSAAVVNAGIDVSCYLMPDWDGPGGTQNKGEQRRFCSRETFDVLGRIKRNIAALMYTYNPQELGTPGGPGNEVYEALAEGNEGVLVVGYGIDPADDFAAGDVADLIPAEAGFQAKGARGSDEFAPLTVTQELGVTGSVAVDSVFVA
jgi:hypothetical protein